MDNRVHIKARANENYRADIHLTPCQSFDHIAFSLLSLSGVIILATFARVVQLQCIWLARCTSLDPHQAGLRYNSTEIINPPDVRYTRTFYDIHFCAICRVFPVFFYQDKRGIKILFGNRGRVVSTPPTFIY